MSKERKPLYGDDLIVTNSNNYNGWELDGLDHYEQGYRSGAYTLRDFYENLITTGKLRVVEEVELDIYFHCKKCGSANSYEDTMSGTMEDDENPFCKGCGNPIKR